MALFDQVDTESPDEEGQACLSDFMKEIVDFLDRNPKTYPLTKAHPQGVSMVFTLIDAYYTRTNAEGAAVALELDEATSLIERLIGSSLTQMPN